MTGDVGYKYGRARVTDQKVDHIEIHYPEDGRKHWVVQPGVMTGGDA